MKKFLDIKNNIASNKKVFKIHLLILFFLPLLWSVSLFWLLNNSGNYFNFNNIQIFWQLSPPFFISGLTLLFFSPLLLLFYFLPQSFELLFHGHWFFLLLFVSIAIRIIVFYWFFYLDIKNSHIKSHRKYIPQIIDILIGLTILFLAPLV